MKAHRQGSVNGPLERFLCDITRQESPIEPGGSKRSLKEILGRLSGRRAAKESRNDWNRGVRHSPTVRIHLPIGRARMALTCPADNAPSPSPILRLFVPPTVGDSPSLMACRNCSQGRLLHSQDCSGVASRRTRIEIDPASQSAREQLSRQGAWLPQTRDRSESGQSQTRSG